MKKIMVCKEVGLVLALMAMVFAVGCSDADEAAPVQVTGVQSDATGFISGSVDTDNVDIDIPADTAATVAGGDAVAAGNITTAIAFYDGDTITDDLNTTLDGEDVTAVTVGFADIQMVDSTGNTLDTTGLMDVKLYLEGSMLDNSAARAAGQTTTSSSGLSQDPDPVGSGDQVSIYFKLCSSNAMDLSLGASYLLGMYTIQSDAGGLYVNLQITNGCIRLYAVIGYKAGVTGSGGSGGSTSST